MSLFIRPFYLSLVFLSIICETQAQEVSSALIIEGVVSDSISREKLAFATVYNKTSGNATITNNEGYFKLEIASWKDTILVSYVGYKTHQIELSNKKDKYHIVLESASVDLSMVTVVPKDYTFLYELLESCKNKRTKKKKKARAYYQLKSYIKNQQIELVEAFFNARVYGYDLLNLKLKAGRIGLRKYQQSFFGSLETSKPINQHKLFFTSDIFPNNPLEYSARRMKRKFFLEVEQTYTDEDSDLIYVVYLFPKKKKSKEDYFFCKTWINVTDTSLVKVELQGSDLDVFPLRPIYQEDFLSHKNLKMTKTFKNINGENFFEQIYFEYDFNYHKHGGKGYQVNTEAILFIYDYDNPFFTPRYGFKEESLTDYQKLGAIPYNQFFWENNDELKMSEELGLNQIFMSDSETVTNYNYMNKQSSLNHFFSYPLYQWSIKRIGFKELPKQTDYKPDEPSYRLQGGIYLDYNYYKDSTNLFTASIFNAFRSYYPYHLDITANCFFNIYFDLIEKSRREFVESINQDSLSVEELVTFYKNQNVRLKEELKIYEEEVERGRNKEAFKEWNTIISNSLGLDNFSIFRLEQRD